MGNKLTPKIILEGTRFNLMAEKLNEIEAMRRRLIGDVSHELRTPLTAIKGSMEGLIDGVLPATDETFQQIHAKADRLNRLADDLQELGRVEDVLINWTFDLWMFRRLCRL